MMSSQAVRIFLDRIHDALEGDNEDQKRIAQVGLEFLFTLLGKNADYGSSVWNPPLLKPTMDTGDAILVRMSDKVSRISTLTTKEAQVKSESLEDTIKDLGAYALLWLARPKEQHAQQVPQETSQTIKGQAGPGYQTFNPSDHSKFDRLQARAGEEAD